MRAAVLSELARFQRQFSAAACLPLDRASGTLRATTAAYDRALVGRIQGNGIAAAERLATYNRQYWFRLFGVLQSDYRLTTALLGAWTFNGFAQQYLGDHPPTGHELTTIGDGFAERFVARLPADGVNLASGRIPADALRDAIGIDAAFRAAMTAPCEPPLELTAADLPRLVRAKLRWSRAAAVVEEKWPLMALRRGLPNPLGDHRAPLPEPHPGAAQGWVICRASRGLHVAPIAPLHARLLQRLRTHTLADALASVENDAPGVDVAPRVREWFADGVRLGLWTGVEDAR